MLFLPIIRIIGIINRHFHMIRSWSIQGVGITFICIYSTWGRWTACFSRTFTGLLMAFNFGRYCGAIWGVVVVVCGGRRGAATIFSWRIITSLWGPVVWMRWKRKFIYGLVIGNDGTITMICILKSIFRIRDMTTSTRIIICDVFSFFLGEKNQSFPWIDSTFFILVLSPNSPTLNVQTICWMWCFFVFHLNSMNEQWWRCTYLYAIKLHQVSLNLNEMNLP